MSVASNAILPCDAFRPWGRDGKSEAVRLGCAVPACVAWANLGAPGTVRSSAGERFLIEQRGYLGEHLRWGHRLGHDLKCMTLFFCLVQKLLRICIA